PVWWSRVCHAAVEEVGGVRRVRRGRTRLPRWTRKILGYQGEPDLARNRFSKLVSRRRAALAMSIVAALAVLLSGVTALAAVDATTASTLRPAGPVAQLQKDLFTYLLWIGSGIFVVVVSLLLYAVFRFRSRD